MHHLAVLFLLWNMPLLPSSTTLFFFLPYILGIRSFFFPILIPFSQLHPFFYTLHTPLSSFLLFLLLLFSSSMLLGMSHTIYFLLVSQGGILVLDFCRSVLSCLYILHSLYILLLLLLLSIFSQVKVHLLEAYSTLYSTPIPFPI